MNDHYAALGLGSDATLAEVQQALIEELAIERAAHPERFRKAAPTPAARCPTNTATALSARRMSTLPRRGETWRRAGLTNSF